MNLATRYLGLTLRNPLVASAGPLSQTVDGVRSLADGGVAAVVLYSLFEEQLRQESMRDALLEDMHNEKYAESLSYFPVPPQGDAARSHRYLTLLEQSANAVDIPVIASLNGSTTGGWTRFAQQMADAGASAIELNIYLVPGDVQTRGRDVEDRHVEILTSVKEAVTIPVAVKLSPFFSSTGKMATRLDAAGADGLVLFNRFLQPEIDIETLTVDSAWSLSTPFEGRLPRTWIAALRGRVGCSLAGTGGVETSEDVAKYLLAGADVVMTTSSLLRNGTQHSGDLLAGLERWLDRKGLRDLDQVRGLLAVPSDIDETAYERAGYVAALEKAKQVYGAVV